tara:strand:+ start:1413 stop:1916 length:504 start_codon:yes stop_codon:yes gene_type:complete
MVKKTPNTMNKNKLLNSNFESGFANFTLLIVSLIIFIIVIILHYSMYTWTEELEKTGCECSNLWQRNIIHWIALIMLIIIPINMLLRFAKIKMELLIPYSFILVILQIFYISIIFDYITKLKKLECECSESWKREYGYIGSIVYIGYLGLILLIGILWVLMYFFISK